MMEVSLIAPFLILQTSPCHMHPPGKPLHPPAHGEKCCLGSTQSDITYYLQELSKLHTS